MFFESTIHKSKIHFLFLFLRAIWRCIRRVFRFHSLCVLSISILNPFDDNDAWRKENRIKTIVALPDYGLDGFYVDVLIKCISINEWLQTFAFVCLDIIRCPCPKCFFHHVKELLLSAFELKISTTEIYSFVALLDAQSKTKTTSENKKFSLKFIETQLDL